VGDRGLEFSRQLIDTATGKLLAQKHNSAGGDLIIYSPPVSTIIRITSIVVLNVHGSNTAAYKIYHNEIAMTTAIGQQIFAGSLIALSGPDIYNLPIWMRSQYGALILNSAAGEITISLYGEEIADRKSVV